MEIKIRLNSTQSVNADNKDNFVDVQLMQHNKTCSFLDVKATIDQNELFRQERHDCSQYRLILTLHPYCTNTLFNAVTEIVQNEGTDKTNDLKIASAEGFTPKIKDYTIKGKNTNVTNTDMVRNTEYANGTTPFIYHCGYDIFNNHLLRRQTFKAVSDTKIPNDRMYFNTIMDYMRYEDGTDVKLHKRTDVSTIENEGNRRHLYLKDDILSFIDSINTNLFEQNGWWGFNNRSAIKTAEWDAQNKKWQDMNISRVFNNEGAPPCGFIEMYPDSSLYSFNPKYNKFQNREEHNWDICLTYPYENDNGEDKVLINGTLVLEKYYYYRIYNYERISEDEEGQIIPDYLYYEWKGRGFAPYTNIDCTDILNDYTESGEHTDYVIVASQGYKWDKAEYRPYAEVENNGKDNIIQYIVLGDTYYTWNPSSNKYDGPTTIPTEDFIPTENNGEFISVDGITYKWEGTNTYIPIDVPTYSEPPKGKMKVTVDNADYYYDLVSLSGEYYLWVDNSNSYNQVPLIEVGREVPTDYQGQLVHSNNGYFVWSDDDGQYNAQQLYTLNGAETLGGFVGELVHVVYEDSNQSDEYYRWDEPIDDYVKVDSGVNDIWESIFQKDQEEKYYPYQSIGDKFYKFDSSKYMEYDVVVSNTKPSVNIGDLIKVKDDGQYYIWNNGNNSYEKVIVITSSESLVTLSTPLDFETVNTNPTTATSKIDELTIVKYNDTYYLWDETEQKYKLVSVAEGYAIEEATNTVYKWYNGTEGFVPYDVPTLAHAPSNTERSVVNALLIADYRQTTGTSGQDIIMFRSYVKHNLQPGDQFKLFYCETNSEQEGNFVEIKKQLFDVANIGDLNTNNKDYYFYTNNITPILNALNIDVLGSGYVFRFVKVINDRDCKYYYRKFRKLPNFKIKKEELTQDVATDKKKFEQYVKDNCCKVYFDIDEEGHVEKKTYQEYMENQDDAEDWVGKTYEHNKEHYPLAFSKTIYGDDNTQIVFTDSIEIDKLTDNLGRPLTELYVTFIKRNNGHDKWYKKSKTPSDLKEIEFSHCFGEVLCGIKVHGEEWDAANGILTNRLEVGDVKCLKLADKDKALMQNVTSNDNVFYGDLVELDVTNLQETVLSEACFRFNTEQREHVWDDDEFDCSEFIYDEIETDDYDADEGNTHRSTFGCSVINVNQLPQNNKTATYRPEGYYHKAHHRIQLRQFGSLRQASHKQIKISHCSPKQSNGMFIEVISSTRSGVTTGGNVLLCDPDTNAILAKLTVNSVQSSVRFLLNPMKYGTGGDNYLNVFEIVSGLTYSYKTITEEDIADGFKWTDKNGVEHIATDNTFSGESDLHKTVEDYSRPKYILRVENPDIPFYAYHVGQNVYLWRDILTVGDQDTTTLKEYPFFNGHFYINEDINFFLRRQDPFGNCGLFAEDMVPNDIHGNEEEENIYDYKEETEATC